ncbi:unnamed protein product [Gordionus sp. m RMFG-2023]
MRNILLKLDNGKIYVIAISLYLILLTCHGEMEWRMIYHGLKSVNVMVEDKGLLKIFKINVSIIKELVQNHSYAIEMKISANFDNSEYEKIVIIL